MGKKPEKLPQVCPHCDGRGECPSCAGFKEIMGIRCDTCGGDGKCPWCDNGKI